MIRSCLCVHTEIVKVMAATTSVGTPARIASAPSKRSRGGPSKGGHPFRVRPGEITQSNTSLPIRTTAGPSHRSPASPAAAAAAAAAAPPNVSRSSLPHRTPRSETSVGAAGPTLETKSGDSLVTGSVHDITNVSQWVDLSNKIKRRPNLIVVFDYGTDSCRPCKQLSPLLNALATVFLNVLFVRVNLTSLEMSTAIGDKQGIESYPTIDIVKSGERLQRLVGFDKTTTIDDIRSVLFRHLGQFVNSQ